MKKEKNPNEYLIIKKRIDDLKDIILMIKRNSANIIEEITQECFLLLNKEV